MNSSLAQRQRLLEALTGGNEGLFLSLLAFGETNPLVRVPWVDPDPPQHDVNVHPDTEQDTLLFHAAKAGWFKSTARLLDLGEDPNHLGSSRMTALSACLMAAPVEEEKALAYMSTAVALLAHGADIDRSWEVGTEGPYTPRRIAHRRAERAHSSWAQVLLEQWWPQEGKARYLDQRWALAASKPTSRL